jgi:hypothetical protein
MPRQTNVNGNARSRRTKRSFRGDPQGSSPEPIAAIGSETVLRILQALIPRRHSAGNGVSKDAPDVSGACWTILRDAASRLLRMRAQFSIGHSGQREPRPASLASSGGFRLFASAKLRNDTAFPSRRSTPRQRRRRPFRSLREQSQRDFEGWHRSNNGNARRVAK